MKKSKTNSGILFFLEKIIRSHPLLYYIARNLIRYTNIFEEDANGVNFLNLDKGVNIIDVGASDGIATKFFNRKLTVNKTICFEPYKSYSRILKKINILQDFKIAEQASKDRLLRNHIRNEAKNLGMIKADYSKDIIKW